MNNIKQTGEIRFVDTTLRDGQLSLWASNMTTRMMLPVIDRIDAAGFEAFELISSAFFKKAVRDLKEDLWERTRLVAQRAKKTPLRSIRSRSMLAFQITPTAIAELWLERLAANGISELRTSDPSNTPSYWAESVAGANRLGLKTILNIIYSISPKHTDDYFLQRIREAAKLDVARICFKDPGGLLTPERTRALVPLILKNANGKPVEFHTHCTTGLGAPSCLEAIKAGIRSINTAIPPLAEASSNPSIFNVAMNARALGYSTAIDEEALKPVTEHFTAVARQKDLPIGRPVEYDAFHPIHQVPGGMISNFRFQLANLGKLDQLDEVLQEVVRVRAEFGYPIMVTPYSQFVGVQAAINVMVGARYKEITDEMIQYALGHWGEEEARSIDANVRDKILSRPRAKELAKWTLPEISVKEFRAKFGGDGVSDDEKILRYFAGEDYVASMKAAPPAKDYTSSATPLLTLISSLAQRKDTRQIFIQRKDFSLRLEKRSAVSASDNVSVGNAEAKSS